MESNRFSFRIANDSDREKVYIEVLLEGELLAEILQEGDMPEVLLFPPSSAKYWTIPYPDLTEALERGKKLLFEEIL